MEQTANISEIINIGFAGAIAVPTFLIGFAFGWFLKSYTIKHDKHSRQ